ALIMSTPRVKSFAAQSYNSLFHIECLFLLQSYSPCIQKTPIAGGPLSRNDSLGSQPFTRHVIRCAAFLFSSRPCAGAHRHHKVRRRRCAHILDSVFVVRMHETHGAWPETVARTAQPQLHRFFSNQPQFRVHMAV